MAEISGYTGKMNFGSAVVSDATNNIHAWTLDINCDALETTDFADSGNRTYIRGLKGWTATCEGYIDTSAGGTVNSADIGSSATLSLYVNATKYYNGTALLTGASLNTAADGVETSSFSFQGSGALAYN